MKKCPYCLSEVSEKAIKCKHCWEFLSEWDKKKNISSKDNEEIWINSKFWRAMVFVYFLITIPVVIGIFIAVLDNFWPYTSYRFPEDNHGRDWWNTILWAILIPVIYLVITDILRGGVYYIVRGRYELYIWKKVKPLIKEVFN